MELGRLMFDIDNTGLVSIGQSRCGALTKISVFIIYTKSNMSQANHKEMFPFKMSTELLD